MSFLSNSKDEELQHTVASFEVNYYQPLRVMPPRFVKHPENPLLPEHFYEPYVMPRRKMNPHRVIEDGANCKDYLIWIFINCWLWLKSYKNSCGLVELDLQCRNVA